MDIETTLLVKQEVFVYQIPPRASAKGYRAADWNLGTPIWTGRLKLTARGRQCNIRLEDRNTGELFANCPVDSYPGVAVEAVTDSSRYFVLRVVDDNGRTAFIGAGFGDRSDSFDMNVAIQDHFKWVRKDGEITREQAAPPQPALDLGFKDGQTIKINMKIAKKKHQGKCDDDDDDGGEDVSPTHQRRPAAASRAGGASGLLPPPPSANPVSRVPAPSAPTTAAPGQPTSDWNDFLSAGGAAAATGTDTKTTTETPRSGAPTNSSWVQF